ncbi:hypothetical protein ACFQ7F_35125 [Streptomyces sp. NPDC056486]|uniref:hypothetical protein n=1 Tax=Streptomyces sp. NPDC056486 TaxID=3345835 RepID=UPI00367A0715
MANDPHSRRARMWRQWVTNLPSHDPAEWIIVLLGQLGETVIKTAQAPRPIACDLLTFDEVIDYFHDERPEDSQVHHGVLLTQRNRSGAIHCLQLFVDRENKPCIAPSGAPYGRAMVANELDRELMNLLAGKELIIFE